jgi:poly-beta-hydroxyalkanoate depolymerase
MLDLKDWREKWAMIEQEEDRLAREMTVEESVRIYLSLCHSYAPMIEDTRDLFLPDREAYLADWRERMRKLTCWLQKQNGPATEPA